ncbi:hypothetical protein [Segnochrobactrum spirostomi]|uniref:Uncharacterized protein n=1 Tax=Segnochrobactrum spirostomi TaxID=2608987 RepID=A0A6A7Y8L6_9HYPH|nr:hypothetical protein [Segnochrobactrum spirostomi]MQT13992.1 hypothetical protein [Segnochrobactrum spirostomi]
MTDAARGDRARLKARTGLVPLALAAGLLALPALPGGTDAAETVLAAGKPAVTGASVSGDATRTRLTLTINHVIEIYPKVEDGGRRVVIDIPPIAFALPAGFTPKPAGLVTAWSYGYVLFGNSRIVLETARPVAVAYQAVLPPLADEPGTAIVDLVPADGDAATPPAP